MIDIIKCSMRNLNRKKLRSFLTTMGISIGVASVIIIGNISQCGTIAVNNELDSLGLNGLSISKSEVDNQLVSLSEDELYAIKEMKNVEDATPVMVQSVDIAGKNGKQLNSILWGIDSTANKIISLQTVYGRNINNFDILSSNNVCMVDENFSRALYGRDNIVGKTISIIYNGNYDDYKIIGIIKTGTGLLQNFIGDYIPNFVYIPYTNMKLLTEKSSFDQIAVKVNKDVDIERVGYNIISKLSKLNNLSDGYCANNLSKQKYGLNKLLNIVTIILSSVGAISLVVASLSIMTVMLVSVNERTKEIGIKKSIGARKFTILIEFLIEALLLSLLGCIIGILIGTASSFIGALCFGIKINFKIDIIITTTLFSMITSVIFGVYPAIKASNLKPVDALRIE